MAEKKQALTPEEINRQRDEERRDAEKTFLPHVATAPPADISAAKADAAPIASFLREA